MKRKYFYLEPYVFISINNKNTCFYNVYNYKLLLARNNKKVVEFAKRFASENNLLVIPLIEKDLEDQTISLILKRLREYFMGDFLESTSNTKPIQFKPIFHIQKEVEEQRFKNKDFFIRSGWDEAREISFYINSKCDFSCSICNIALKQFPFCSKASNKQELDLKIIKNIVKKKYGSLFKRVNILGGDIFKYTEMEKLISLLNEIPSYKKYYINNNWLTNGRQILKKLEKERSEVNILTDLKIDEEKLEGTLKFIKNNDWLKFKFIFIMENEEAIEKAENFIDKYQVNNYDLLPYYNSKNIDFFKDNVFINIKELMSTEISIKEIFLRSVINPSQYGKIVVLNNGDVKANNNTPVIGNIYNQDLGDIILKEISNGSSWKMPRQDVEPCKDCVFNCLCPPITNYEHVIGKHDLCSKFLKKIITHKYEVKDEKITVL